MRDNQIVDSSFTAIINAPLDKIDLPKWAFTLPDHEYQSCSPAHVATGFTTAPDGKRMSINVEVRGGVPTVQHYVETLCANRSQTCSRRAGAPRSTSFGSSASARSTANTASSPTMSARPRRPYSWRSSIARAFPSTCSARNGSQYRSRTIRVKPRCSPHAAHELNGPTFAHAILTTGEVIGLLPGN
jgi:hypothetical protein